MTAGDDGTPVVITASVPRASRGYGADVVAGRIYHLLPWQVLAHAETVHPLGRFATEGEARDAAAWLEAQAAAPQLEVRDLRVVERQPASDQDLNPTSTQP